MLQERLMARVSAVFGGVALLLAIVAALASIVRPVAPRA
jgi:Ca2+/Na+ antiporter